MILFPNCKINLGLNIVNKRNDGFHNIETIFYPVAIHDVLEIIEADTFSFKVTGIHIPGNPMDNICVKAYILLRRWFDLPPVNIHLHKNLPLGAGLGGGSADGAFTLRLLNEKFDLGINQQDLISLALQLGSDCPFFIQNKPCFAKGRGEVLTPVLLPVLTDYELVVINPQIHINTGWAFSQIQPHAPAMSLKDISQLPIEQWQTTIINDFEAPIFISHPEVKAIKEKLIENGAVYASMSGSGSSVYGFFKKHNIPTFNFPAHYFIGYEKERNVE